MRGSAVFEATAKLRGSAILSAVVVGRHIGRRLRPLDGGGVIDRFAADVYSFATGVGDRGVCIRSLLRTLHRHIGNAITHGQPPNGADTRVTAEVPASY